MDYTQIIGPIQATWQGEFLKVRRKSLGLTSEQLARRINCSRPLIGMWEQSKSAPTGHLLVLLGVALNCHPNEFYVIEAVRKQENGNV